MVKKHNVKVSQTDIVGSSAVNFLIKIDDKVVDISINSEFNYMLIHHSTTIKNVVISKVFGAKISELNENGSVLEIALE